MLTDLYLTLCKTIPRDEEALFGLPLAKGCSYWLAINSNAFPALLLPARENDLRPDIVLRAVEALFSRVCVVETSHARLHKGCFSLIRLKENDPDIVRLFLKILDERFCIPKLPRNNAAIAANIQEVATLFSRLEDNTCDLIGLWGELYFLSHAMDTDAAARCWSTRQNAKYDFVSDEFLLDVKTTIKELPRHRFSLKQLRPSYATKAFIASLCVTEVKSGQTVGALMDLVTSRIVNYELRNTFLTQCLAKGGCDLYRSEMALRTLPNHDALSIYRVQDIPVPEIREEDPIENVRFDVDLASITPLSNHERNRILEFRGTGKCPKVLEC